MKYYNGVVEYYNPFQCGCNNTNSFQPNYQSPCCNNSFGPNQFNCGFIPSPCQPLQPPCSPICSNDIIWLAIGIAIGNCRR